MEIIVKVPVVTRFTQGCSEDGCTNIWTLSRAAMYMIEEAIWGKQRCVKHRAKQSARTRAAIKAMGIALALLVVLAACTVDPVAWSCEYNYDVSWDTGGYAAETGYIRAQSVEYLSGGAIRGIRTVDCGEFFVSPGEAVITVRSR